MMYNSVLMSLLLGIDTGGTYTDAVLYHEQEGVIASAKALTTKHNLAVGIQEALEKVLQPGHDAISLVSLSTTLATNAIVEGQGCPICLLLIGYPPDALEMAELGKALGSDPVVFITGGHTLHGDEQAPLDLHAARSAILEHAPQVEAFAVSGYFAVHNPTHELRVRELARQLTGKPVTCGHELTSNLHAPRRALTAALNARLIPFLQQLILSVQQTLAQKGIHAPLMVVKGDGSLVNAQTALEKPVETILSGPAASVVGARQLAGEQQALVVDMGGTTTDIALLNNGQPALSRDGARVGGWHTMVEAVAVHTSGLGGDSEVRWDEREGLVVGPQRVVPLSLLAVQYPAILNALGVQQRQAAYDRRVGSYAGRFALRQRSLDDAANTLEADELEIWQQLERAPQPLEYLYADRTRGLWLQRALDRLVRRGLAVYAAFTPSDAAHVLGYQNTWLVDAARLGAELWARRLAISGEKDTPAIMEFSQRVFEQVSLQLGRAALGAALSPAAAPVIDRPGPLRQLFIDRALGKDGEGSLVDVALTLKNPLVAVGAPAETYFPAVAQRLHTRLVLPAHAGVANAVGAVVGSVVQSVRLQIRRMPDWQGFRLHLPDGVRDFEDVEAAAAFAEQEAARIVVEHARRAGAASPEVQVQRHDQIYHTDTGAWEDIYLGSEITATAVGRPVLGS